MIGEHWPQVGLEGLYHLSDVNDAGGYNRTLTNYNSVAFVAGKFGNAANFGASNTNKYLAHTNDFGIDPLSEAYTISFWAKINGQPTSGGVYGAIRHSAANKCGAYIGYWNDSGSYKLIVRYSSDATVFPVSATYQLIDNTWYWIVFTSTAAGTGKLYVNGHNIATGTRGSNTATSVGFNIGGNVYLNNSNRFWSGMMDEVAVFSRVWTDTEIRYWYAWSRGLLC